jgi:hypothetical protein
MHYSVSPQVVNETIDGEAVMINLETGAYYSLRGVGAAVWDGLQAGATVGQIVDHFAEAFSAPRTTIEADLSALVAKLEQEELIVATQGPNDQPPTVLAPPPGGSTYVAPTLEKFTDMEDLILLDPVHEVDDRGWPHRPSDPKN